MPSGYQPKATKTQDWSSSRLGTAQPMAAEFLIKFWTYPCPALNKKWVIKQLKWLTFAKMK